MQSKSSRGVQLADVSAAADELLSEGLRPTIERVRMKMGRGSPNTVAPMLETWFTGLGKRLGFAPQGEEGKGVPAEVREAIESVWKTALSASVSQVEASQSANVAKLVEESQRLSRVAERLDLREKLTDQRERAIDLRLTALQDSLAQSQSDAASLKVQLDAASLQLREAQNLALLDQQRLAHELEQLRQSSATSEKRHLDDKNRLLKDVDQERLNVAAVQKSLEKSRQLAASHADAQHRTLAEKQGQMEAHLQRIGELEGSQAELRKQRESLVRELECLRGRLESLTLTKTKARVSQRAKTASKSGSKPK